MAKNRQNAAMEGGKRRRWWRWPVRALGLLVLAAVLGVGWPNVAAWWVARGKVFDRLADVPGGRVGLVFGCDDRFQGRENLYFRHRIDAAAELWKAGKLKCLIVSGDNETKDYNEPRRMRNALVARGVPVDKIVCDRSGFRTLDSVVRAKKVFLLSQVTFISQRFQNERAIYLAKANGIDAVAYNAQDVTLGGGGTRTKLREVGARVKMWLDVNLLATPPRHLGEPIKLPE